MNFDIAVGGFTGAENDSVLEERKWKVRKDTFQLTIYVFTYGVLHVSSKLRHMILLITHERCAGRWTE